MNILQKISAVFINRFGVIHQKIINILLQNKKTITYKQQIMEFFTPNALCKYRVKTFATKEPNTLNWIESFAENTVFWDIGANIGLYSIYATKARSCKVFAFEPSVFNLEFLAKNIHTNKLQEKITIFPIALSNKIALNLFKMNHPVWGGALSSFAEDFDQHGSAFKTTFTYAIPGLTGDEVVKLFNIPTPNYLKIDVDGIEHLILAGSASILKTVTSVLVEINEDFLEQSEKSKKYLSNAGLVLLEKYALLEDSNQYNQLWVRK